MPCSGYSIRASILYNSKGCHTWQPMKKIIWFSDFQNFFTGISAIMKGLEKENSKNPIFSYHVHDLLSNFHIGHLST